ncbi:MAG: PQQ-dependent dehydrogenase, methanol/ethanol family, partial [Beijerinckiaceae bacterium]
MRNVWILSCVSVAAIFAANAAMANDNLEQMSKNPKNWVMQGGNYEHWNYSTLKQINAKNVKNLQPMWTFSTGVLRGHESSPLVIGDVMYL